jgi:two-component system NarL family sensor kinase
VLVVHAARGLRIQVVLRVGLALFVLLTVACVPPARHRTTTLVIGVVYAAWSLVVVVATWRARARVVRLGWLALFADLLALTAAVVVAGASDQQSWTADLLVNGFFLIPVLAATQLRPVISAAIGGPTVVVYLVASAAAKSANTEPWASILLRSAALTGLAAGCVLLTRVQRSRVRTISGLATDRSRLAVEILGVEQRERRALAEALHDGALQYVLAARQDLEDFRDRRDETAFHRIDIALRESSQLLRSTLSELHPAVLAQAGLSRALHDLVSTSERRGLESDVDTTGWPDGLRSAADHELFATARELVTNVVKHADARTLRVELALVDEQARLQVTDDGRGVAADALGESLADGHIGLASCRTRIEAAGGRLTIRSGPRGGTVAVVVVPIEPVST